MRIRTIILADGKPYKFGPLSATPAALEYLEMMERNRRDPDSVPESEFFRKLIPAAVDSLQLAGMFPTAAADAVKKIVFRGPDALLMRLQIMAAFQGLVDEEAAVAQTGDRTGVLDGEVPHRSAGTSEETAGGTPALPGEKDPETGMTRAQEMEVWRLAQADPNVMDEFDDVRKNSLEVIKMNRSVISEKPDSPEKTLELEELAESERIWYNPPHAFARWQMVKPQLDAMTA